MRQLEGTYSNLYQRLLEQPSRDVPWKGGPQLYGKHVVSPEARLIVIGNRIVKETGFDWFDKLENAPGF